jgi:hypothetical protein
MEIGDSFLVHNGHALNSARAWIKRSCPDIGITARQNDSGYRVWRIK